MEAIQLKRRERNDREIRAEAANMLCEQDEIYEYMQRDVNDFLESTLAECTYSKRVAEDVSETDVLVPTFSPSVMMDKY